VSVRVRDIGQSSAADHPCRSLSGPVAVTVAVDRATGLVGLWEERAGCQPSV